MKARQSAQEARAEAQSALQEIQAAKKITAGKSFTMHSKCVEETFLVLILNLDFPGAFTDLPRSISDVAEHYRAEEGMSRRSYSGPNILDPNIRCPSATN